MNLDPTENPSKWWQAWVAERDCRVAERDELAALLRRASHDVRYSAVKGDTDSADLLAQIDAALARFEENTR